MRSAPPRQPTRIADRRGARLLLAVMLLCGAALLGQRAQAEQVFFPKTQRTRYSDWFQAASHNTYYNKFKGSGDDWHKVLDYTSVIEFDVWSYDSWKVYHNVAGETYCHMDLNGCLKVVRAWHDQHKDHDPITIFLEMKSVEGFRVPDLNGLLCGPTRGSRLGGRGKNDAIFTCDELFRPGDLLRAGIAKGQVYPSLREAAQAGAWPSLAELKGKIIFVMGSGHESPTAKYLAETKLEVAPGPGRDQAVAFIVYGVSSDSDITGVPHQLADYDHRLARQVIFYNGECGNWKPAWAQLIRKNNYLSRGYYCGGKNLNARTFESRWIGDNLLNFVAYDKVEVAYGLSGEGPAWNGGSPQGDFSAWEVRPDRARRARADWSSKILQKKGLTRAEARRIADSDPRITHYFFVKGSTMVLTGHGSFEGGTAVFFSGEPALGEATGMADSFVRRAR